MTEMDGGNEELNSSSDKPSTTFSLFSTPEQAAAKSSIVLPHMRQIIAGEREEESQLPVLAYDYDPEDEIDD